MTTGHAWLTLDEAGEHLQLVRSTVWRRVVAAEFYGLTIRGVAFVASGHDSRRIVRIEAASILIGAPDVIPDQQMVTSAWLAGWLRISRDTVRRLHLAGTLVPTQLATVAGSPTWLYSRRAVLRFLLDHALNPD